MGFTFSHPALVIPFKYLPRRFYSVTGLVAGSMIPDLEYFIGLRRESYYSHNLFGLLWLDLPQALIAAFLFHQYFRNILIRNLPAYFRLRLSCYETLQWGDYLRNSLWIVIISILIGGFTHLLWDSFTSFDAFFVRKLTFLHWKVNIGGVRFYVYKLVKHGTSILGALFIIYQFHQRPCHVEQNLKGDKYFWLFYISLFLCTLFALLLPGPSHQSYNAIVKTSITGGLLALLGTTGFYYRHKWFRLFRKP